MIAFARTRTPRSCCATSTSCDTHPNRARRTNGSSNHCTRSCPSCSSTLTCSRRLRTGRRWSSLLFAGRVAGREGPGRTGVSWGACGGATRAEGPVLAAFRRERASVRVRVRARARACVCRELLTSRSNDPADRIGRGDVGACVGVEIQLAIKIKAAAVVTPAIVICVGVSVAEPHPRGCDLALVLRRDVRKPRRLAVGVRPPHVFSCKVRGTVVNCCCAGKRSWPLSGGFKMGGIGSLG